MFRDFLVSWLSSISILQVKRKRVCIQAPYPVYTCVYNVYKNSLTSLFVKVGIVDTDVYNVDISAPNSGGDVSNTSQVRSTYCADHSTASKTQYGGERDVRWVEALTACSVLLGVCFDTLL
jgi:hypothetical protein